MGESSPVVYMVQNLPLQKYGWIFTHDVQEESVTAMYRGVKVRATFHETFFYFHTWHSLWTPDTDHPSFQKTFAWFLEWSQLIRFHHILSFSVKERILLVVLPHPTYWTDNDTSEWHSMGFSLYVHRWMPMTATLTKMTDMLHSSFAYELMWGGFVYGTQPKHLSATTEIPR